MPDGDASDPVREAGEAAATLRERYDELARIEARIADLGRDRIETAADAYRRAHRVLDQYEEDAVGTGDFGSYVQFRGEFGDAVDADDDALAADAFAAADEAVDKRRLSEADFAAARDALEPAGEYVDLLTDRDEALDDYRAARKAAREAEKALDARLDELREVAEMADADLDADVDRLRGPIESYNDAVREAFETFYKSASAREVFAFLDRADGTPFVDADVPPTDLREYVADYDAGEEPLPTLLEYADYSNSKLEHYVDDPGALRTAVAVHRTYVERLDAEPLTLDWPPAGGDELAYEIDELIPLVSRVADDETVATLRSVRDLARDEEYHRLRRAAVVRDALDEPERDLLKRGVIDDRVREAERTVSIAEDVLTETKRE
jgi:tetratricopeptide (TPR) repeat protein